MDAIKDHLGGAPIALYGLSAMVTPENGAVRLVSGDLEVFAPHAPFADSYTGNIFVRGHLIQIFDDEYGKWVTECPAVDGHFILPSEMTPEIRAAAEIDRAAIAKATTAA